MTNQLQLTTPQSEALSLFEDGGGFKPETIPSLKIAHSLQLFQMPDDSTQKELDAIIIDAYRVNVYWSQTYDESGGSQRPDCYSMGGITPGPFSDDEITPQASSCSDCVCNQFGSAHNGKEPGKGKACKNLLRLYLLLRGQTMPVLLTLPPTSLRSFDDYVAKLYYKGLPYQAGRAKITLAKKDTYSKVTITLVEACTEMDTLAEIAQFRKTQMPMMRKQQIEEKEGQNHE